MRRLAFGVLVAMPLAGCDWLSDTLRFGGVVPMPFDAQVAESETDPRDVLVVVAAGTDVTLEDFRESARYPVTRYCIENYGTSQAEWTTDPATRDWAVTRTTDGAVLQARCTGR